MSVKFQHEFWISWCSMLCIYCPHHTGEKPMNTVACVHWSMKTRSCGYFAHCYSPRFCCLYYCDTHIPMTCIQSRCSLPHHEIQQMNCCLMFCRICAVKWGSKICPHYSSFPLVGGLDNWWCFHLLYKMIKLPATSTTRWLVSCKA